MKPDLPHQPPTPDAATQPAGDAPSLARTHISGENHAGSLPRGTLLGRYFVAGLVGEGGMASVYSAYDPELDRRVAIKLLKLAPDSDLASSRAQLLREAQAMARLSHPNVVPIYDAGTFEGQLFVAMELVEGKTLQGWLDERPRRTKETVKAFVSAGEGLAAANAAGLVHRDFKPANVLFGRDGRVRVSDFGLAHLGPREGPEVASSSRPSSETFSGTTAGTPAYMAPEQFAGAPTDARADQFSFCASLWEALTGELPFGEGDWREIRQRVLCGELKVPRRPPPRWLAKLLVRGLSVRPEDRWPSMEALLALLRRDRLRRVRQAAEAALLVGVVAGAASWIGYHHHLESTRCAREARAATASLFGPERGMSLTALGPDGEGIAADLRARAAEWETAHQAACEAATRGAPAAEETLSCLDQYWQRTRALVGYLPNLTTQKAYALLDELSRPARCQQPRPRTGSADLDPHLLEESTEVSALAIVGRYAEAVTRGRSLLKRAHDAEAPHVAAFTAYYLGLALWETAGPTDELLAIARQAVRDADVSGDGELSVRTRVRLFNVLSEGSGRHAEAEEIALDAEAWLKRLGYPAHLDVRYTSPRASLLSRLGRHDEAAALFRRAIRLEAEVHGSRSPSVADAYNDLGTELLVQGRFAEAAENLQTAIDLHHRALWHSRPSEALAWGNLAVTRLYQGRAAEALSALDSGEAAIAGMSDQLTAYHVWLQAQRALALEDLGRLDEAEAIERATFVEPAGLEGDDLCSLHASLARILVARGKPELARAEAERALETGKDRAVNPTGRAEASFALAQALWGLGDKPRAVDLAKQALAAYPGPENGHQRGKIERWLTAHSAPPTPSTRKP